MDERHGREGLDFSREGWESVEVRRLRYLPSLVEGHGPGRVPRDWDGDWVHHLSGRRRRGRGTNLPWSKVITEDVAIGSMNHNQAPTVLQSGNLVAVECG